MEAFSCSVCASLVFFDNSACLSCGSELGFDPGAYTMRTLRADGDTLLTVDERSRFRRCANKNIARCNWLLAADSADSLCASCRLTSVRPNDSETDALDGFADAEAAKRRLLYQIHDLGLPIVPRAEDPDRGLTFEFLSSRDRAVTTGHAGGVITLDLSESDDAHREFVRQQLGEPYRTVLGHLRHEIGHHYWPLLVETSGRINEFRSLFGDEREPYQQALHRHYNDGAPDGWDTEYVSEYATMHPWEDWAETFSHYLHIHGGLETADSFGLQVGEPSRGAGAAAWTSPQPVEIGPTVARWLGMTIALNGMSRSIGQGDLYPFVLSATVVAKLDFVLRAITQLVNDDEHR